MQQVSLLSIANPTSQAFPFPSWTHWGPGLARQREDIWRQVRAQRQDWETGGQICQENLWLVENIESFMFKKKLLRNTFVFTPGIFSRDFPNETVRRVESACSHTSESQPQVKLPNTQISQLIIYPSHPLQLLIFAGRFMFLLEPKSAIVGNDGSCFLGGIP